MRFQKKTDDPIIKEYLDIIYVKFETENAAVIKRLESDKGDRIIGLHNQLEYMESLLGNMIFDVENYKSYLSDIKTEEDKLNFLFKLKASFGERSQKMGNTRIKNTFLQVVETDIEEIKTKIQLEPKRKGHGDLTLRMKVIALMLLTFRKIEKPEKLSNKIKLTKLFHAITGGDIKTVDEFVDNPILNKGGTQSTLELYKTLIGVKKLFQDVGFIELVKPIQAVIDEVEEESGISEEDFEIKKGTKTKNNTKR